MDQTSVLQTYFGYSAFRPGQKQLIDSILGGRDALGIMPTGGGKSLCYQIPALLLPGITLVVSPLISLMKDQVAALKSVGISAAFINSSLSGEQLRLVFRRIGEKRYKILYVAPERLDSEAFTASMQRQDISMIAVDEAHCISQWGQDFRPSYLKIAQFISRLPSRPVVSAFTATATAEVQRDIEESLALRSPLRVVTGFDRPNLFFDVCKPKHKQSALLRLMTERRGKSGIVYCATRAAVESVCDDLAAHGFAATRYHAGLADEERRQNQEDFQNDRKTVMVATNAFGMGIDKSNIGFVFHYHMPKSLEAYYQEAGRAGRDGENADCILLYSPGDVAMARFLLRHSSDHEELSAEQQTLIKARDDKLLDTMIGYCKTTGCLRGYVLAYFGQAHENRCENCGNCKAAYTTVDITRQAQMILSCVKRVKDRLGYYVGAALIVRILHGSRDQRVISLGMDQLSTYGLLRGVGRTQIREYIDYLSAAGYVSINPGHLTLEPAERSAGVLFRGETVQMPVKAILPEAEKKRGKRTRHPKPEEDDTLYEALRGLRTRLAQEENVPAYVIFSNATLADMTVKMPQTIEDFLDVSGVGKVKASRYAEPFLRVIAEYGSKS